MYQVANLGRGSTEIEDLERLPADWERAKFSTANLFYTWKFS